MDFKLNMNCSALLSWKTCIVFAVFCFIFFFSAVEADRIRIVQRNAPVRLYVPKSSPPVYAKKYSYNSPISRYSTPGKFGENRFPLRRNGKGPRNYANGYRNWSSDNNKFNGGVNKARIDNRGPQKKRRDPPFLLRDPPFNNKQKQRNRPHRENVMQRPLPPRQTNDFDEDYYFPEEAVRTETKFDLENNFPRPKKRRRNPSDSERVIKGPELKFPVFSEKPNQPFKPKNRNPPFSYSTFVQHPNGSDEDEEEEKYVPPVVKNKKKKLKKKSNIRKKTKDEDQYSADRDEELDGYQSVTFKDYDAAGKRSKKPNKKPFGDDDDLFSDKNPFNAFPTLGYPPNNVGLLGVENNFNVFKDSPRPQFTSNFPSFPQRWNNIVETTARPIIQPTNTGLLPTPFGSNQFNFQNSYQNLKVQPIPAFSNSQPGNYFSQPDNTYTSNNNNNNYNNNNNNNNHHIPSFNTQPNFNYNYNQNHDQFPITNNQHSNSFSNSLYSTQTSPTFQQSSNFYKNSVTVEKSVPIYDSTHTYFNYNPFAEGQVSKHQGESQVYKQTINSHLSPSYGTSITSHRADDENDFVKKHQSLYNKGLSGVPIQGDGYGSSSVKKDYDIGYGDFQFDENPSS